MPSVPLLVDHSPLLHTALLPLLSTILIIETRHWVMLLLFQSAVQNGREGSNDLVSPLRRCLAGKWLGMIWVVFWAAKLETFGTKSSQILWSQDFQQRTSYPLILLKENKMSQISFLVIISFFTFYSQHPCCTITSIINWEHHYSLSMRVSHSMLVTTLMNVNFVGGIVEIANGEEQNKV